MSLINVHSTRPSPIRLNWRGRGGKINSITLEGLREDGSDGVTPVQAERLDEFRKSPSGRIFDALVDEGVLDLRGPGRRHGVSGMIAEVIAAQKVTKPSGRGGKKEAETTEEPGAEA